MAADPSAAGLTGTGTGTAPAPADAPAAPAPAPAAAPEAANANASASAPPAPSRIQAPAGGRGKEEEEEEEEHQGQEQSQQGASSPDLNPSAPDRQHLPPQNEARQSRKRVSFVEDGNGAVKRLRAKDFMGGPADSTATPSTSSSSAMDADADADADNDADIESDGGPPGLQDDEEPDLSRALQQHMQMVFKTLYPGATVNVTAKHSLAPASDAAGRAALRAQLRSSLEAIRTMSDELSNSQPSGRSASASAERPPISAGREGVWWGAGAAGAKPNGARAGAATPPSSQIWGQLLCEFPSSQPNAWMLGPSITVGRSSRCTIQLHDHALSALICRIRPPLENEAHPVVEGCTGRSLLFVNGAALEKGHTSPLRSGDTLLIDGTRSGGTKAFSFVYHYPKEYRVAASAFAPSDIPEVLSDFPDDADDSSAAPKCDPPSLPAGATTSSSRAPPVAGITRGPAEMTMAVPAGGEQLRSKGVRDDVPKSAATSPGEGVTAPAATSVASQESKTAAAAAAAGKNAAGLAEEAIGESAMAGEVNRGATASLAGAQAHAVEGPLSDEAAQPKSAAPNQDDGELSDASQPTESELKYKALCTAIFSRAVKAPQDAEHELSTFPHYLSDNSREVLLASLYPFLKAPATATQVSGELPPGSMARTLLLRGPPGTELYHGRVVAAVAKEMGASFLMLRDVRLSREEVEEVTSASDHHVPLLLRMAVKASGFGHTLVVRSPGSDKPEMRQTEEGRAPGLRQRNSISSAVRDAAGAKQVRARSSGAGVQEPAEPEPEDSTAADSEAEDVLAETNHSLLSMEVDRVVPDTETTADPGIQTQEQAMAKRPQEDMGTFEKAVMAAAGQMPPLMEDPPPVPPFPSMAAENISKGSPDAPSALKVGDRVFVITGRRPRSGAAVKFSGGMAGRRKLGPPGRISIQRHFLPMRAVERMVGFATGSDGPQVRPSPPPGAKGVVILTFDENAEKVCVKFDTRIPGGTDLGGRCGHGHGLICLTRELGLEKAHDVAMSMEQNSVRALLEAALGVDYDSSGARSVPTKQSLSDTTQSFPHEGGEVESTTSSKTPYRPCIVYMGSAEGLLASKPDIIACFRRQLSGLPADAPLVFIGSSCNLAPVDMASACCPAAPSQLRGMSGPSAPLVIRRGMGDVIDVGFIDALQRLAGSGIDPSGPSSVLFSMQASLHPPRSGREVTMWERMIADDVKEVNAEKNIADLRSALSAGSVQIEVDWRTLACHKGLQSDVLSPADVSRIVGWAISLCIRQLDSSVAVSEADGAATSNADSIGEAVASGVVLTTEHLRAAISMLSTLAAEASDVKGELKEIKTDNEFEANLLQEAVVAPGEIGVTFDDVQIEDNVKRTVQEMVMLPLQRPELFQKGILSNPCMGILLFGPPGTGKTLLSKAVATQCGAHFLSISPSTVASKWFGEGEKYIAAVFSLASKLAPSIIFVDEVDSMLGKRDKHGEHDATRKMKNQFFQLWDGLRTNAVERVLVMGVTNRPFDLDDAVLRRFQRRLLIDVPNSCLRAKVLKHMLRNDEIEEGAVAEEISRDEITGGFTGSDLKNLCIAAAYRPLREMLDAEAAIDASKSDLVVPLKPRKLRLKDFEVAAKEISSSISEDSMGSMELRKWNETYGDGGSRLKANLPYFL